MAGELVLEKVRLEVADGVATLTLNDPGALNVTGYRMGADLRAATEYIADMAGVRAILLNAEGKHFCGGGDLRAMQATFGQDPTAFFTQALVDIHHAVVNLHSAPIPVVAAVQGFAAGAGANLPLAADIVLAADDAQFFQAFVQVGLAVDSGGAWFLPRAIGDKRALYYLMTGAKMNAAEAYNLGLVSRVVPGESLQQEA
ncbi:MAG TPA: enoyl-CoA hydratase/isomerase family protein, partial [bacterium]|nr:enoyl-CoA hydratase/isomerase family protein [bacterium]